MTSAVRRFSALSRREKLLTFRAAAIIVALGQTRRFVSFRRLSWAMGLRVASSARAREGSRPCAEAAAVDRALRLLAPAEGVCLLRSMALAWLLREQGAEIRIGASRTEGAFRAHAWVEVAGEAIGEAARPPSAFAPLWSQWTSAATESTG